MIGVQKPLLYVNNGLYIFFNYILIACQSFKVSLNLWSTKFNVMGSFSIVLHSHAVKKERKKDGRLPPARIMVVLHLRVTWSKSISNPELGIMRIRGSHKSLVLFRVESLQSMLLCDLCCGWRDSTFKQIKAIHKVFGWLGFRNPLLCVNNG